MATEEELLVRIRAEVEDAISKIRATADEGRQLKEELTGAVDLDPSGEATGRVAEITERVGRLTTVVQGLNTSVAQGSLDSAEKLDIFSDALTAVLADATSLREELAAAGESGTAGIEALDRSLRAGQEVLFEYGNAVGAVRELGNETLAELRGRSEELEAALKADTEAAKGFEVALEQLRGSSLQEVTAGVQSLRDVSALADQASIGLSDTLEGRLAQAAGVSNKALLQLFRSLIGGVTAFTLVNREMKEMDGLIEDIGRRAPAVAEGLAALTDGLGRFKGPISFIRTGLGDALESWDDIVARFDAGGRVVDGSLFLMEEGAIDAAKSLRRLNQEISQGNAERVEAFEALDRIVKKVREAGDVDPQVAKALREEAAALIEDFEDAGQTVPDALRRISDLLGGPFLEALGRSAEASKEVREELGKSAKASRTAAAETRLSAEAMTEASEAALREGGARKELREQIDASTRTITGHRDEMQRLTEATLTALREMQRSGEVSTQAAETAAGEVADLLEAWQRLGGEVPKELGEIIAITESLISSQGSLNQHLEVTEQRFRTAAEATERSTEAMERRVEAERKFIETVRGTRRVLEERTRVILDGVAAIQEEGKVTEETRQRVGAAVQELIEDWRVFGEVAPAALRALEAQFPASIDGAEALRDAVGGIADEVERLKQQAESLGEDGLLSVDELNRLNAATDALRAMEFAATNLSNQFGGDSIQVVTADDFVPIEEVERSILEAEKRLADLGDAARESSAGFEGAALQIEDGGRTITNTADEAAVAVERLADGSLRMSDAAGRAARGLDEASRNTESLRDRSELTAEGVERIADAWGRAEDAARGFFSVLDEGFERSIGLANRLKECLAGIA